MDSMKLKQMQCIKAVVENRYNVTAAAATLKISQPAVSKQIQIFEGTLGGQVFHRGSRSMLGLTEMGEKIMPEIDRILSSVDKIRHLSNKI